MRIPTGDFGYSVARPQPGSAPVPNAAAVGEAVSKLGKVGMDFTADLIAADVAERKKQELAAEKAREQADKIESARIMVEAENSFQDLNLRIQQGIQDGSITKDAAQDTWHKESTTLRDKYLPQLPEGGRKIGDTQMTKLTGNLRRDIDSAVFKRNLQDVSSNLSATLEGLERSAMTDMPGSVAKAERLLDTIGPSAGLTPEKIQERKQQFREKTSYTMAWDLIRNARNDISSLNVLEGRLNSDEFYALDPQKKASLGSTITTYRAAIEQKREADAMRAERERERHLKNAEATFNTFQSLVDKGSFLDPAYVDATLAQTAGTPYRQGVALLAQSAKETGGVSMQPIQSQQAMLDRIDQEIATHGRTPALDKRREQVSKIVNASKQDLQDDPLRAGLERGVISNLAPIDLSDPANIGANLKARLEQADMVSLWAGQTISPFDASEAAGIRDLLNGLQPKNKSQTIALITNALPPKYATAFAKQLDKDDRALGLAFNFANAGTTGATNWLGRQTVAPRFTSELVVKGAQALKDGTVLKDSAKVTGWRAKITKEVAGVYPDANMENAVKDAAFYILAGLASENKSGTSDDVTKAVRLASGGDFIEHNGKKIPLIAGMSQEQLDKRLRTLSPDEMNQQAPDGKVRAAGLEVPIVDFVQSLPGQQLMYAGPGRYSVLVRGRPVTNMAGKPIVIGVNNGTR